MHDTAKKSKQRSVRKAESWKLILAPPGWRFLGEEGLGVEFVAEDAEKTGARGQDGMIIIPPPPGCKDLGDGEGLAGGLSEEHDQGIEEVVREELQGACGDVVAEADLGGRLLRYFERQGRQDCGNKSFMPFSTLSFARK